jgi:cytochrome c oxidase subunit 1
MLITFAGLVIGWSVLIMSFNLIKSARSGVRSGANPWHSRSPEWQIPSPAPEMNYERPPVVVGDPYDYAHPDTEYVSITPAGTSD